MGERKVLNKYIPADFDPRLVPRGKKPKDDLIPVRMMLPFSIQCSTCSSFMYRGTKFNSKKEAMRGANGTYLGIQRYRLYIKCTTCARPITFCTDPKNTDYEMESGGTRNYEVWHDKSRTEEEILKEKEKDEKLDPMKALENRVLDSQREMQDMENLDEIKAMNMRHLQMQTFAGISSNGIPQTSMLSAKPNLIEDQQDVKLNEYGTTEEEEELLSKIRFGKKKTQKHARSKIKRINEQEEQRMESSRQQNADLLEAQQQLLMKQKQNSMQKKNEAMPLIKVKRKRLEIQKGKGTLSNAKTKINKVSNAFEPKKEGVKKTSPVIDSDSDSSAVGAAGLGGLLGAYGSSSDSD